MERPVPSGIVKRNEQFDMIYFDNAATSYRKPQRVIDAVCTALSGMGNAGRGAHQAALDASRLAYETRCMLSDFFGGYGGENVAFTSNSTEAINTVISGLFGHGDHVITTALEHNSVLRPLYRLEEAGAELTVIRADSNGCVDYGDFEKAIQNNTKAIVCTHGSNLTGNLLDIKIIGDIAERHGLLFIVDASQTAGVFPIDMKDMKIDALCITGHKSLMAPQGIGALLIRSDLKIRPLKVGGSGIRTYDHEHPDTMPTRLEAGTLNMHGIAGLHAALLYLHDTGMDAVREKELSLARLFYEGIQSIPGITVYGDFSTSERAPIVSLNIGNCDSGQVSDILFTDYGIETRPGGHCAPLMHEALGTVEQGAVRFSFGWFNTPEEVMAAAAAIRELADY